MQTPISINNIPITISRDQWNLISEAHPEVTHYFSDVLETIENPDILYAGMQSNSIAVKEIEKGTYLTVLYKEKLKKLTTVFLTREIRQFDELEIIWKKDI